MHDPATWALVIQAVALVYFAGKTSQRIDGHGKAIARHDTELQQHDRMLTKHATILKTEGLEQ